MKKRELLLCYQRDKGVFLCSKVQNIKEGKNQEERQIVDQPSIEGASLSVYLSHLFAGVLYQLRRKLFRITSANIIVILQVLLLWK